MKKDALVQFKLMIPAGLKGRVEASAEKTRRSLSQEIVAVLEEKFPEPEITRSGILREYLAMSDDQRRLFIADLQQQDPFLAGMFQALLRAAQKRSGAEEISEAEIDKAVESFRHPRITSE